ncbi:MAG TPA: twin-arginine translocation signal domain-containing protein [Thermomicrobiales bacterium]|nr:twin-arginine translocation signal domain-containing protein [Thermomicrobiales bacterium]
MIHQSNPLDRRRLIQAATSGGVGAALAVSAFPSQATASELQVTASGAGVNLKLMPDESGKATVPMRESFAFDAGYAQCIVEDNPARFSMDTFSMGRVVIEPHRFFMAMYADTIGIHAIQQESNGSLTATLLGALFCATFAGTSSVALGSRDAKEHARFKIEATDGGYGANAPLDRFAFTVYFDPNAAPVNHAIFGPEFTFTGEMIAGKVTIGPPITVPLSRASGPATPGT